MHCAMLIPPVALNGDVVLDVSGRLCNVNHTCALNGDVCRMHVCAVQC